MNLPLFIALKFLKESKNGVYKHISTMLIVCFLSIALSNGALLIVASIMNGFEKSTCKIFQGVNSDIIIKTNIYDLGNIEFILNQNFKKKIQAFSTNALEHIIVKNCNKTEAAIIKAINPLLEPKIININSLIISGKIEDLNNKNIIIGYKLAQSLNILKNDSVILLYSDTEQIKQNKIILDSRSANIIGIIKTGIDELDEHLVICSLEMFEDLFDSINRTINIKINSKYKDYNIIEELKKYDISAISWKDLYPSLIDTLKLEKYIMILLLAIMAFIASMNIIALLFMFITYKQKDLVILVFMGLHKTQVSQIFLYLGSIITFTASIMGLSIGSIICILLKIFPISIPDAYYTNILPVELDVNIFTIILLVTTVINIVSISFSAVKAKNIDLLAIKI